MKKPLLIEVGVEELPAIPLLKNLKEIEQSWKNILQKYSLESDFHFYYTPRRLVLIHDAMPLKQADAEIELFGPPVTIAVKEGVPTKRGQVLLPSAALILINSPQLLIEAKRCFTTRVKKRGLILFYC